MMDKQIPRTLMEDIFIYDKGEAVSLIRAGHRIEEVVPVLENCVSGGRRLPVYVVADANAARYADALVSRPAGRGVEFCGRYLVEASEQGKTMETVLSMTGWLLDNDAGRNAFVLAVGGGITTDMAGFAASIYKRGIRFAYIPTTLLSQVDAAIGGKTGVNFDSYKNMIGVIRQPEFTFICPEVLDSLPLRDFLSGAAEMVKSFVIEDHGDYGRAVDFLSGLRSAEDKAAFLSSRREMLCGLIHAAASVKAGIVSRDQFESGERRKLNLGHTFAHAIEKNARTCGDDITHGEAVSIGIVMAAELSFRTGLAGEGFVRRLMRDFADAGLPVRCPYPLHALAGAMSRDKKAEDGNIHFVLPVNVGEVLIKDMTAGEAVKLLEE